MLVIWFKMLALLFCLSVLSSVKSTIYRILTELPACADPGQEMERRTPVCCLSGSPAQQSGQVIGKVGPRSVRQLTLRFKPPRGAGGASTGEAACGLACPHLSRTRMPEALPRSRQTLMQCSPHCRHLAHHNLILTTTRVAVIIPFYRLAN